MENPVLSDPAIYPSEDVLSSYLGKSKSVFKSLFEHNHSTHPDFVEKWNYYKDGKRWLLNVSRKGKTVFWLSVSSGSFRTGFYINSKVEQSVKDSNIPVALKKQYAESSGKKIRGISLELKVKKDMEIYKELLKIKLSGS